jgi:hypothetical protein
MHCRVVDTREVPLESLTDGEAPLESLTDGEAPLESLTDGEAPLESLTDGEAPLESLSLCSAFKETNNKKQAISKISSYWRPFNIAKNI